MTGSRPAGAAASRTWLVNGRAWNEETPVARYASGGFITCWVAVGTSHVKPCVLLMQDFDPKFTPDIKLNSFYQGKGHPGPRVYGLGRHEIVN
jgi:hypothetical protein